MGYLIDCPESMELRVTRLLSWLEPRAAEFSSILVTGLSGVVPGSVVAWKLRKTLVVVRKEGERSHGDAIEGELTMDYIILDDFISVGDTFKRLMRHAWKKVPPGTPPKYLALHRGDSWHKVMPFVFEKDGAIEVSGKFLFTNVVEGLYTLKVERSKKAPAKRASKGLRFTAQDMALTAQVGRKGNSPPP